MFLLISGGSGAGKSACLAMLRERWLDVVVHEDDERPPPADGAGRQALLEGFVAAALRDQAAGRHTLFGGQAPLGELLACPSAIELDGIGACLLDCADVERTRRVRRRQPRDHTWFGQDHLNWAAWHRMHAHDPTWEPRVLTRDGDPGMQWQRWTSWPADDPRWRVHVLDTTDLSIVQCAERLAAWVEACRRQPGGLPLRGRWWSGPPKP